VELQLRADAVGKTTAVELKIKRANKKVWRRKVFGEEKSSLRGNLGVLVEWAVDVRLEPIVVDAFL
jgi:hypothetical protein